MGKNLVDGGHSPNRITLHDMAHGTASNPDSLGKHNRGKPTTFLDHEMADDHIDVGFGYGNALPDPGFGLFLNLALDVMWVCHTP